MDVRNKITELIEFIYGKQLSAAILVDLNKLIEAWQKKFPAVNIDGEELPLTEQDTIMISYGDSIKNTAAAESPLKTLKIFADEYLQDMISTIHILPFSPYSSDDGFSVIDYRAISPELGNWDELRALGQHFKFMFDLVLNHCSKESAWFKGFLADHAIYKDYFIKADPANPDLKKVFRPRALPLLHTYKTAHGEESVWTTFSEDQVDMNFANPTVLLEFIDIFLYYLQQGAQIVRLDAIGFLWKELGTKCMHHPKTHAVVQLLRSVLKLVYPEGIVLTETNVPHKDNISYFGDGTNEAQMVYQFALPPLTLDAYIRGDASHLSEWASSLAPTNKQHSYFNFLASHDGIGMLPAQGYLSKEEQDNLIARVQERGAHIGYKNTAKGRIPYELNINYADAVAEKTLDKASRIRKILSAQSTILSMAGVPGIYIHSILGSANWNKGVEESGINRRINREKLEFATLKKELEDPENIRHGIFNGFNKMLKVRRSEPAFNPSSEQKILSLAKEVFAVQRKRDKSSVICLSNTSAQELSLSVEHGGTDLLSGKEYAPKLSLQAFETIWLKNIN